MEYVRLHMMNLNTANFKQPNLPDIITVYRNMLSINGKELLKWQKGHIEAKDGKKMQNWRKAASFITKTNSSLPQINKPHGTLSLQTLNKSIIISDNVLQQKPKIKG